MDHCSGVLKADIAALDAVTWKLIERHDDLEKELRVLDWTSPTTPALPFITSVNLNADHVLDAVEKAIKELSQQQRDAMFLIGVMKIPTEKYLAVPNPS